MFLDLLKKQFQETSQLTRLQRRIETRAEKARAEAKQQQNIAEIEKIEAEKASVDAEKAKIEAQDAAEEAKAILLKTKKDSEEAISS